MKKLKVILAAVFCVATLAALRYLPIQKESSDLSKYLVSASSNAGNQVDKSALLSGFVTAYNEGYYKRHSIVNLQQTAEGLEEDFVGPVSNNVKDTYFHDKWLWMSTNSGYKGTTVENPTSHFKYVDGEEVTDYNISASQNVSFYTLKSFIDTFDASKWSYANGTWVTGDDNNLTMGLGFLAPCFKNTTKDPVKLDRITVTIESDGSLTFSLYAESTHSFVVSEDLCIATTTVTAMSSDAISAAIKAVLQTTPAQ